MTCHLSESVFEEEQSRDYWLNLLATLSLFRKKTKMSEKLCLKWNEKGYTEKAQICRSQNLKPYYVICLVSVTFKQ